MVVLQCDPGQQGLVGEFFNRRATDLDVLVLDRDLGQQSLIGEPLDCGAATTPDPQPQRLDPFHVFSISFYAGKRSKSGHRGRCEKRQEEARAPHKSISTTGPEKGR
jgi:hypothetical protein